MKNWNEIEGHWTVLKGRVKEKWADLTDDDLGEINGQRDQLVGKLQTRSGMTLEEAEAQVNHFVDEVNSDRANWFNMSNDADAAMKGGGTAGAVVGAIAGAAAGPLGAVVGAAIGGVAGGAASAAAVGAVDKHDNDGSIKEKS
ncbi:MAG: CsbD family protein [Fimbriimonadaceae bacterium]